MTAPLCVWPVSASSFLARPKSVILGAESSSRELRASAGGTPRARSKLAAKLQQDVRRLQITVDDAMLMGVVDGPRQSFQQLGRLPRRQRRAVQLLSEAAAVHELQREEGQAILFTDFVDL